MSQISCFIPLGSSAMAAGGVSLSLMVHGAKHAPSVIYHLHSFLGLTSVRVFGYGLTSVCVFGLFLCFIVFFLSSGKSF